MRARGLLDIHLPADEAGLVPVWRVVGAEAGYVPLLPILQLAHVDLILCQPDGHRRGPRGCAHRHGPCARITGIDHGESLKHFNIMCYAPGAESLSQRDGINHTFILKLVDFAIRCSMAARGQAKSHKDPVREETLQSGTTHSETSDLGASDAQVLAFLGFELLGGPTARSVLRGEAYGV